MIKFLPEPMEAEEVFLDLCPHCQGTVAELSHERYRERIRAEARKPRPYLDPETMQVIKYEEITP